MAFRLELRLGPGRAAAQHHRRLVGAQTADVNLVGDFAQLHYARPFERGYLVNWETQTAVWDQVFSADHLAVDAGARASTRPAGRTTRARNRMMIRSRARPS